MTRSSALPIALLTVGLALLPTLAHSTEPGFWTDYPRIDAGEEFRWSVPLRVRNPYGSGLYVDSLSVDTEDMSPGVTGTPRTTRVDLPHMARMIRPVSAHDSTFFQYEGEATLERARLTFHIQLREGLGGAIHRLSTSVETDPGAGYDSAPAEFVTVKGRLVELTFLAAPPDSQPAPAVLLIHGRGSHARRMIRAGLALANKGFAVMLVSLPGYGQSPGTPDHAGPASLAAAEAALDQLKKKPGVRANRLGVWGLDEGANVALQLGQKHPEVSAVVLQSGLYDAKGGAFGSTGNARSSGALLVIHGEKDPESPVAGARELAERLGKQGARVEQQILPTAAHSIPTGDGSRRAAAFLARELPR